MMRKPEKVAWEIRNEKNKASVRWLLVVFIAGYLGYLLQSGNATQIGSTHAFNWFYIGAITAFVILVNIALFLLLNDARESGSLHPAIKYATMIADLAAISLVLVPTGGSESMFFVLYFIVIVSNSLRYGMRAAISGVIAFNVFYVAVLGYQYYPATEIPGFHKEVLKVAGFWLVGLYTGYLSRRFELLQGEVEKYERLLSEVIQKGQVKNG